VRQRLETRWGRGRAHRHRLCAFAAFSAIAGELAALIDRIQGRAYKVTSLALNRNETGQSLSYHALWKMRFNGGAIAPSVATSQGPLATGGIPINCFSGLAGLARTATRDIFAKPCLSDSNTDVTRRPREACDQSHRNRIAPRAVPAGVASRHGQRVDAHATVWRAMARPAPPGADCRANPAPQTSSAASSTTGGRPRFNSLNESSKPEVLTFRSPKMTSERTRTAAEAARSDASCRLR
jgi:hypothetical protein